MAFSVTYIEGLDNVGGLVKGSFAMFSKKRHAVIDGTAGRELTAATHDLPPDYKREPKAVAGLSRGQLNHVKNVPGRQFLCSTRVQKSSPLQIPNQG